jgi:hypothetical protein
MLQYDIQSLQGAASMLSTVLKLSAAVAIVAATPALAQAQNSAYVAKAPITITSFRVNDSYAFDTIGTDLDRAPQLVPSDFSLKFINTGNVAATAVTFSVNTGRSNQTFVDKGTFSPGVQIKHYFNVAGAVDELPSATCNVMEVDFADGSVWQATPNPVAGM